MKRQLSSENDAIVYAGTRTCQTKGCEGLAYYELNGSYRCGRHANKNTTGRRKLKTDPNRTEKRAEMIKMHWARADTLIAQRPVPRRGRIQLQKMYMMKQPPMVEGWLNIFPNRRATGQGAFPELSPMCLGPVVHGQPGLPDARSVENYHQFNKVWRADLDPATQLPGAQWQAIQRAAYLDEEPHRHRSGVQGGPVFSVHLDDQGNMRTYSYVESRVFYCRAYAKLAQVTFGFGKLRQTLADGYDLMLCGYDAPKDGLPDGLTADQFYTDYYCNPGLPFGHELVLYAMLRGQEWGEVYPWERYVAEHPALYADMSLLQ